MSSAPNWYQPPAAPPGPPTGPAGYGVGDDALRAVQYGTFGVRLGARLIDVAVGMGVGFAAGIVGFVVAAAVQGLDAVTQRTAHAPFSAGAFALGILGSLSYHALAEGIGGATLGKLALGLRVRRDDLSAPRIAGGVLRTIAYVIDAFLFGAIAYGSMSKSPTQQRLGDKWAHTVVVRAATLPRDAPPAPVAVGLVVGLLTWFVCAVLSELVKLLT